MKSYTHPSVTHTLLIQKDGSSFNKYWLYPRATVSLETSDTSKQWESNKEKRPIRRFIPVSNFQEKINEIYKTTNNWISNSIILKK